MYVFKCQCGLTFTHIASHEPTNELGVGRDVTIRRWAE